MGAHFLNAIYESDHQWTDHVHAVRKFGQMSDQLAAKEFWQTVYRDEIGIYILLINNLKNIVYLHSRNGTSLL